MTSKVANWTARGRSQEPSDLGAAAPALPGAQVAVPRPRQLLADLALLFITVIWGGTFVMVKDAVAAYPVFSFLALRFTLAALALSPLVIWQRRRRRGESEEKTATTGNDLGAICGASGQLGAPLLVDAELDEETPSYHTATLLAPFLVGFALFAGYGFQTGGLQYTTPAKAGFITGLSVVIVPLVAALILRQSPGRNAWLGIGSATAGLVFLAWQPGQRINAGDALVFCCALSFAAHILLTGRFASRIDPLLLTLGQLITVAVLSALAGLAFETRPPLTWPIFSAAAFTGLLATSVAFGIQTAAQRFTTTTHTALILSAEPVFAALFSLILIGEALGPRQLAGSALILAGMLAAEFKSQK